MSHRRPIRANLTPTLPPRVRVGQSGAVLISLGLVAISCWMLAGLIGQVLTSAQIDRQQKELRVAIARIERENADLKRNVTYAESPAYAEQVAREQLGMAREGDTVILPTFPDTQAVSATATVLPLPVPRAQPNWQGWHPAMRSLRLTTKHLTPTISKSTHVTAVYRQVLSLFLHFRRTSESRSLWRTTTSRR